MFFGGTLGAVGNTEHSMMGSVGEGRQGCFQVSRRYWKSRSLTLALVAKLQRPFELVPREVLSDRQL